MTARQTIFSISTNPVPVTFDEVAEAVEFFDRAWNTQLEQTPYYYDLSSPAYSFAHVVLDDLNLGAESIDFCLGAKGEWYVERLSLVRIRDVCDPDPAANMMDWGKQFLDDYTEAIVEFLNWLKTLPEEVRERP